MDFIVVGYLASLCTSSANIPQIARIIRSRSGADVSYVYLTIHITGCSLWGIYGTLTGKLPLVFHGVITFLLLVIMLTLKLYFQFYARKIL
jgi:MtN3 and saliva related transmembrane protein